LLSVAWARGSAIAPYRCSALAFDLDTYRERAERFNAELQREYYRHFAGHKPDYEVEAIYDRYADVCTREAVEALRELAANGAGGNGADGARRVRYLLHFALDGYLGRESRREEAALAEAEASLEIEVGSRSVPYRMVPVEQANEADAARRAELEAARNGILVERLNPLHLTALERSHELVRELGWRSYAAAYSELRELDLDALGGQMRDFLAATEDRYPGLCDPELERHAGVRLGSARRSDLPRFFRAESLDGPFDAERLVPSFAQTVASLGFDLEGQENVHLDTDPRPTKSPRAFCAIPLAPREVYLVVKPIGGRDDYAALFHEGGHTEHYANVDPGLAFEYRQLGDNAVTESFAFLIEGLVEDAEWLTARLGVGDPEPLVSFARAGQLLMLRRYASKLAYELELHGFDPDLSSMPDRYAELLTASTRFDWTPENWIADVDGGFYVACYLRAWALDAHWRRALRDRFGERWFDEREAGRWLTALWREGQRLSAEELLATSLDEELDFSLLVSELLEPR
jgi:hypothetical protein